MAASSAARPAAPSGEAAGEVVFNTAMTGYQEILTDPSYRGQIVCMTYPLIGNYGINEEDVESRRPWVDGFIVKEACPYPSSWRGRCTLDDYLERHGIVGIQGIDTRALTRHLRDRGAQEGIISTVDDGRRPARRAGAARSRAGRTRSRERGHGGRAARLVGGHLGSRARLSDAARCRAIASSPSTPASSSNILRQLASAGLRARRRAGPDAGGGGAGAEARRDLPLQWARRPGGGPLPGEHGARPHRPGAHLRHLPRQPDPGAGRGREHLQAQVRPPWREPPGAGSRHRARRDHRPEPRLRGGPDVRARGRASRRRTSTSTTAPPRACAIASCRSSRSSTTRRPRRGLHDAHYLFDRFVTLMEGQASARLRAPEEIHR